MDDVIISFTPEQFLQSTEPYEYLVAIDDPMRRDRETAAFKKFALKQCSISASTFKQAMQRANAEKLKAETGADGPRTDFSGLGRQLLCPGYICNDGGIWKQGAFGLVPVLSHPLAPVKRVVNVDTGECKTLIAFRTGKASNRWHEQVVSREALSSRAQIVRQLSSVGAYVTSENCPGVISYLADVESANYDKLPIAYSTSRMGWTAEGKFTPYDGDLMYDGDARYNDMYHAIRQEGDSGAWYDLVAKVRRGKSIAARVMLAASFASVLIKPLATLPFIVHCWSDVSGTGKTVALMLAASVWADPSEGLYVRNLNATNNAVEMVAGFLNSLPMCFDELCAKDRREGAENLVYMVCESNGRSRASRNGGLQTQQRWRNCALTTGETPILTGASRAGAENRVIDLEVSGPLFDDPIAAANTVRANYGFAGKALIASLAQEGALDVVRGYYDKYLDGLRRTGATAKQAIPMATILAADRWVASRVLDDTHNLTVDDVASLLKSQEQVDTNRRAYEWLMGTIAENNARFEPTADNYNGPVWGKLDEAGPHTVACIIRSRFSALLADAGYNDRSFLKWAKRAGVVETSEAGEPTKPVRVSGVGNPVRCVCIRMNALDAQETAPDGMQAVDMDVPF